MIYITGDTHGDFARIEAFCRRTATSKRDDLMVILGDAGVNYYEDERDVLAKEKLQALPLSFFLVRGNHEARPNGTGYQRTACTTPWFCGDCMVEQPYDSLYFAMDGGLYDFFAGDKMLRVGVVGGAYSVDKAFRLNVGWQWFDDEQLSPSEQAAILRDMDAGRWAQVTVVFSHACPYRVMPRDTFLPLPAGWSTDESTERFLDCVLSKLPGLQRWFCGHYHIERQAGRLRFVYEDVLTLEEQLGL